MKQRCRDFSKIFALVIVSINTFGTLLTRIESKFENFLPKTFSFIFWEPKNKKFHSLATLTKQLQVVNYLNKTIEGGRGHPPLSIRVANHPPWGIAIFVSILNYQT
jgi:hypothetical protein